jgi:glutamate/tyrosine decarboxylase-like PLP-dependent enzyme
MALDPPSPATPAAGSAGDHTALLEQVSEIAAGYLGSLGDRPVWARASYDDMLASLGGPLPEGPTEPASVVAELATKAEPGLTATPSGRFYGFVIGGVHPAALGADWLTTAWDQNAGLTAIAPANAACETIAGGWLLDLLGLPPTASVGYVTGGMQANFTCLAAARHDVLARAGWDVERRGLVGAPPVRVVVGADRHGTIDLAIRYLGLGTDSLTVVPSDDQGRISLDGLTEVLEAGTGPTIVCLQAGEIHTGAVDPLAPACDAAHHRGAWVHIDGAFGLWAAAAAAAEVRALTAGAERANSWATDGHKTLNVPYDCGFAIVRDQVTHRATFGARSPYLIATESGDPCELVPELSRRARGFPVWAVLRSLGRSGVADLIDGLCRNARRFAAGVADIPGVTVLNDVVFTQVTFAFGSGPEAGANGAGGDELTQEIGRRVLADGSAVLTPSTWRGRAVLRCSVSNWSTTEDDIDRTVAVLARLAAELSPVA